MPLDEKISYLIENLRSLPEELVETGVDILVQAGETEYAVVLAKDNGMIEKAIEILVNAGDYLWAALISKNAGMADRAEDLYRDGLDYYVDMEMYGRAISAATALKMSAEEIDALFRKGIEVESRCMDLRQTRAMIDDAMDSLEIALIGRDDRMSQDITSALQSEKKRMAEQDGKESEEN